MKPIDVKSGMKINSKELCELLQAGCMIEEYDKKESKIKIISNTKPIDENQRELENETNRPLGIWVSVNADEAGQIFQEIRTEEEINILKPEEDADEAGRIFQERRTEKEFNILKSEEKVIILLDLVDFSKASGLEQVLLLKTFDYLALREPKEWLDKYISNIIPTGDGYFILAEKGIIPQLTQYLETIRKNVDEYNQKQNPRHKIGFRCAVHKGEVYKYKGSGANNTTYETYIGDGLNDCKRIFSFIPKNIVDVVYFSESIYYEGIARHNFIRLGIMKDKHNKEHKVFQLQI